MVASFGETLTNKAGLGVGVAAFYMFIAFFSCGLEVSVSVYLSEIFPTHIRPKGMAIGLTTFAVVATIYLEVAAIAFAGIGWKYYLVSHFLSLICWDLRCIGLYHHNRPWVCLDAILFA